MELPNLTLNMALAVVGATLADCGFLDQAERVVSLVGHQDVNGRSSLDAEMASEHGHSILEEFGEMSEACADALVEWATMWSLVTAARETIAGLEF